MPTNTTQDENCPSGSSTELHQRLVHDILRNIGSRPDIRVWKNATGVAKSFDGERTIQYGLKGSSDMLGIHKPTGKLIAIEVKTGNATQSKHQLAFEKMITEFGGIYILARSVDDALQRLNVV